jgi:hypothetical protein
MSMNKLTDLNNHLFEQMERLNDDELNAEQLEFEQKRTKSMAQIATAITNNARLVLDAQKYVSDTGTNTKDIPPILQTERITDGKEKTKT